MTRQDRFDAAVLHQLIETLRRAPTTGVDADTRGAEFILDLEALVGVLHISRNFVFLGTDKTLVRGQANQIHAIEERVPL
jgi:hypothetical protein